MKLSLRKTVLPLVAVVLVACGPADDGPVVGTSSAALSPFVSEGVRDGSRAARYYLDAGEAKEVDPCGDRCLLFDGGP